eukprot:scaffold766_cov210-Alexandrium_tamarense.AAC.9
MPSPMRRKAVRRSGRFCRGRAVEIGRFEWRWIPDNIPQERFGKIENINPLPHDHRSPPSQLCPTPYNNTSQPWYDLSSPV